MVAPNADRGVVTDYISVLSIDFEKLRNWFCALYRVSNYVSSRYNRYSYYRATS